MDASDLVGAALGWWGRLRRVASSLIELHLDLAKEEADREGRRLAQAVVMFTVSAVLLTVAMLLLHAAAAGWLHELGLRWPLALLALAGADTLIAVVCLAGAERSLRGPWMKQTRERVARTAASLRGGDEA